MKRKYLISDICDTLYYSNTTFDFISYIIRAGKVSIRKRIIYHLLLDRNFFFFWLLIPLGKFLRKDLHKIAAVKLLKNEKREDIRNFVNEFYWAHLESRAIRQSFDLIGKKGDDVLILASSSISPVVEFISSRLEADYVATEVEFINEVCTGKILNEISGRKLSALNDKLHILPEEIDIFISDNLTDKELMSVSQNKYAVCYNQQQYEKWSDIKGINFIILY